jgi:hypothetical protein
MNLQSQFKSDNYEFLLGLELENQFKKGRPQSSTILGTCKSSNISTLVRLSLIQAMCSLMSPLTLFEGKALEIRVLEWRANHTQVQMQNYILQGHINTKFSFSFSP